MAMVATVLGTALSFVGQMQAADAQAEAANFRAAVAERNRQIAIENAERVRQRGQVEQQNIDFENKGFLGTQVATQGASGLSLGGRSQLMTREAARRIARLDSLQVRQNAELEAFNQELAAQDFEVESSLAKMEAKNARKAGRIRAFTSLISGAGKIASQFNKGGGGLLTA